MIESEAKKARLTEMVTRWCETTKVMPYLWDYDIPALVSSILDEFYKVTFCCGHKGEWEDGVHIEFYEYQDKSKGTVSGIYCRDCVKRYKKELGAWEVKNRSH